MDEEKNFQTPKLVDIWQRKIDKLKEQLIADSFFINNEQSYRGFALNTQTKQVTLSHDINISDNTDPIAAEVVTNIKYLASGSFGDVYRAQYTGEDENFKQTLCTKVKQQDGKDKYYFVLKYPQHLDEEFQDEQQTVTDIYQSKTNKSHLSLAVKASTGNLSVIISPFELQKFNKDKKMVTRDLEKFLMAKTGKNKDGNPKLAHDDATLLLGTYWDMYIGLHQCWQAGYLHLDNAPRNYLMCQTIYEKINNKETPIHYGVKLADFGQARAINAAGLANEKNKESIPLMLCSANRIHHKDGGYTGSLFHDVLYTYKVAMIEEVALKMGGSLKSLFAPLVYEWRKTKKLPHKDAFTYSDIGYSLYYFNNDKKVLECLYDGALRLTLAKTKLADTSEIIPMLQCLKDYLCTPAVTPESDLQLLDNAFDTFIRYKLELVAAEYTKLQNANLTVDEKTNIADKVYASLKRLSYFPPQVVSRYSIDSYIKKLNSLIGREKNSVTLNPIDPSILEAAKKQDFVNATQKAQEIIKEANQKIALLAKTPNKKRKYTDFLIMLSEFEKIKSAHDVKGITAPQFHHEIERLRKGKGLVAIYKAYKNITNGITTFNPQVDAATCENAIAAFINELNELINQHKNIWKQLIKSGEITQELLNAFHALESLHIALTPELIVEYGLNQPDKIHPKLLKHLGDLHKLTSLLDSHNDFHVIIKKPSFYQRHTALTWGLIGLGVALGVVGIAALAFFTSGVGLAALPFFAKTVIAIASTVGISTTGFSTAVLGGIGFGVAAAAFTGALSSMFAGVAAGIKKVSKLFVRDVVVNTPASAPPTSESTQTFSTAATLHTLEHHQSTDPLQAAPAHYDAAPNPDQSNSGYGQMPASSTGYIPAPDPNAVAASTGYGETPATSAPITISTNDNSGYGNGLMSPKSASSPYPNLDGSSSQYVEAPADSKSEVVAPGNTSGYGEARSIFDQKAPTDQSGYGGLMPTGASPSKGTSPTNRN